MTFEKQLPDGEAFAFTLENQEKAQKILARYPADRTASAVMPLLDLAQRQNGGWLSKQAISYVADFLGLPEIRVWEVATFYSMYFLKPVGRYVISVCGTTPCGLCGSAKIMKACEKWLGIRQGETTDDGMFTLLEVECLGACANAPVVQINDSYYEDLTEESITDVLAGIAEGVPVKEGSQKGRRSSESLAQEVS